MGLIGVSSVPSGRIPRSIIRGRAHSRYASYPSSNLPLYVSMYSCGAWCGAWLAPGQNQRYQGLLGSDCLASRMNDSALSARSFERWYPSSGSYGAPM